MTTALHDERLEAVLAAVRSSGAASVLDLGCGGGALLTRLLREPGIGRIVGIDPSADSLQRLRTLLLREHEPDRRKVTLIHGSLTEQGEELAGFDCAVMVEVIEHIDPDRLSLVERAVFRRFRPATIITTTPNAEFNRLLGVPEHRMRHPDHRFEWTRAKFQSWAGGVARRNGYDAVFSDVPAVHPDIGGPTQMAVFTRAAPAAPGP